MSESTYDDRRRRAWLEALKRFILPRLFTHAIVGGAPQARYLRFLGFQPERIARGYDVVDNEFISNACDLVRLSREEGDGRLPNRYFLSVSRLVAEKNLSQLIASFINYRRNGGSWSLVVVGDGPLKNSLEQQTKAGRVSEFVFLPGRKSLSDLILYYAHAGCLILPSTSEPWGLVVNEAMAAGLPLIVSRRCGCAEDLVEHGGNGFLFHPDDGEELTDCMLRVAQTPDHGRTAMGQRSRQIVANYSPQRWASEVARILSDQMSKGPPTAGRRYR